MKLHIQLEPYNGVKFDFIEVEVANVAEIAKVYNSLKETYGEPKKLVDAKTQNGSTKVEFANLKLSQLQIDKIKGNGWTEQDLIAKGASYETLRSYIFDKKPQGQASLGTNQLDNTKVPWENALG